MTTQIAVTADYAKISNEFETLFKDIEPPNTGTSGEYLSSGELILTKERVSEFISILNSIILRLTQQLRKDSETKPSYKEGEAMVAEKLRVAQSSSKYTYFYDQSAQSNQSKFVKNDNGEYSKMGGMYDIITKMLSLNTEDKIKEYVAAYVKLTKSAASVNTTAIAAIKAAIGKKTDLTTAFGEETQDGVIKIDRILEPVYVYFTKSEAISSDVSGPATVPVHGAKPLGYGGGGLTGGAKSYLQQIKDIDSEILKYNRERRTLLSKNPVFTPLPPNEQTRKDSLDLLIDNLNNKKLKIKSEELFISRRRNQTIEGSSSYKINENEYLINQAVKALKNNETDHEIPLQNGTLIPISDFAALREYIINYTNDPITLLLRLTNLNPINLDDMLPKIIDDKLSITTNDKGILQVKIADSNVEMPNPLGNKANREEFNKKFKANTCYGLGGDTAYPFCVSLLNHCLASDKLSLGKCKNLFASPDWSVLKELGIQNTNIFLIKEFLLKIGYPRTNDTFNSDISSWFEVIKTRYDLEEDKSLLENIQRNEKLKEVIEGMVTKYNKIIKAQKSSRDSSSTSLKFHLPMKMKGGDNNSLLNANLYELNGGRNENLINFSSVSPSEKIYNIFKELVKDQNITTAYKNFFDKMQKNIENNNHNIETEVVEYFNDLLRSFKASEEKLNKLLQTMHNFAWFLGKNVDSTNLSDEEKKLNTEANNKLSKMLNEETIQAYNKAREKLLTSLNNRSKKMIAIAASHPMILIANS
jgi:hypothetical protein